MTSGVGDKELEQEALLQPWLDKATQLISRRLRDARSHADSGNIADAADRIDELKDGLKQSVLWPAREEFFTNGLATHRQLLPSEIVQDVAPTSYALDVARTQPILNTDQGRLLDRLAEAGKDELMLTAGMHAGNDLIRPGELAKWEQRHRDAITSAVTTSLSNAQVALHNAAGRVLVRENVR